MEQMWQEVIWRQFGASIDMFGNALNACPDRLWATSMWNDPIMGPKFSEFWYVAYHTLFWLDLYLSGEVEGFAPPPPFTLDELDPRGVLLERPYTRNELQRYLVQCRQKCQDTIMKLTDERARQIYVFSWDRLGISFAELLLDNMRHVQEHGAQLSMFLGQQEGISSGWVALSKGE